MYIEDFNKGDIFPVLQKEKITKVQHVKYAGASGDFNPLHTVEEAGKKAGTGIITHGMLVMGMVAQGVTGWVPRKHVHKLSVRFKQMTRPGETIKITGKVLDLKENNTLVGEVQAMNLRGEVKVEGKFEAILPSRNDSSR